MHPSGVAAFLASGLFQHTFGDAAVVMLVYALMTLPFIVERGHSMLDPAGAPPGAGELPKPLSDVARLPETKCAVSR